jgi:RNA polymerase sigma-70 factor (ECF subfamily)
MTKEGLGADAEWIRGAVREFEQPLLRYAARLVGNLERARDVVQDTFLRLCAQKRADIDGRLAEWLFTVCRNRALDVQRKERRMSVITDQQAATRVSPDPAPPDVLELKDSASAVLRVLGTLPANQQEVLRLKFQNGLSYREISRVTNLSVSNVGFLIHTGLKSLRAKLADAAPGPQA